MIDLFQEWAISPQHSAYARLAQSRIASRDVTGLFAMYDDEEKNELQAEKSESKVAVVKVSGILSRDGENCTVSMMRLCEMLKMLDKEKMSVIISWHTPGGTVMGLRELAYTIENMSMPVVSYVSGLCCSAGYWAAAKSDYIIANQLEDNRVGSVGVYSLHQDYSQKNEKDGIKVTYIYAGTNKIDGNPDSPLADEVLAEMQESVNATYADFLSALSVRKIQPEALTGKTYKNEKALSLGLIDELGTLETAINHARKLALISNI